MYVEYNVNYFLVPFLESVFKRSVYREHGDTRLI